MSGLDAMFYAMRCDEAHKKSTIGTYLPYRAVSPDADQVLKSQEHKNCLQYVLRSSCDARINPWRTKSREIYRDLCAAMVLRVTNNLRALLT